REYLTTVRNADGRGAPGVFAPVGDSLAGYGYLAGAGVIALTLALTLTSWLGVVYKDPTRVALLQTAGLVLGGWLVVAGLRSAGVQGTRKLAGHWVYVDPLHLYEAFRERVRVTPIHDIAEASYTHNYNNGAYQNSVIRALRADGTA